MAFTTALIAMGVGTALSAVGQYQQGQATSAANEYNAKVAEQNAKTSEYAAKVEATKQRNEAKDLLARQRVLYAKAGVDITSGSPLLVMSQDAAEMEREAQTTEYNGLVRSTGYLNEARGYRYKAKTASQAGTISAATTLVSGIGSMGMSYLRGR